jgi:hypothetical protein
VRIALAVFAFVLKHVAVEVRIVQRVRNVLTAPANPDATLTIVRLVWVARARYATATRTRNAVMIKTRLTAAIRIKPAVKEVVVTRTKLAVMALAVIRSGLKGL